ncbi:arginine-hydroxylase NDUFAF5, mitochondrial-like isoform X2 [Ostrea edulis]|uniref:arginine-hydroxylase NDUFAF5, mitochondrial-like isoform X2 n=1 Tax=Ostrea edulis TaxID=37623 RepID=UPI00209447DF|nr:arginine-hydroxylase NDUFAF5, mitochondrial-like isoform X2 [Ostrea edulis]
MSGIIFYQVKKSLDKLLFQNFLKRKCGLHEQRFYTKGSENIMNVFDRKAKRLQRDRSTQLPNFEDAQYVKDEIGYRTYDRLLDIKREFDVGLDLGCGLGYVSRHILKDTIKLLYQCEMSEKLLRKGQISPEVPTHKLIVDEEFLPFKDESLDVVFSSLSLHWVNDLPGCFRAIQKALKPDCPFIGSMFGGDTLFELRVSLQLAEQELQGGVSPHISPFTDVRDLGNLLNRAGFTMLTIDIDEIKTTYDDILSLMMDLKGMAENNCVHVRRPMLSRKTLQLAEEKYREMYNTEDGLEATFQIINFIGWSPHPSQPKPLQRGSAQFSLKDLDKIDELNKLNEDLNPNKPK